MDSCAGETKLMGTVILPYKTEFYNLKLRCDKSGYGSIIPAWPGQDTYCARRLPAVLNGTYPHH